MVKSKIAAIATALAVGGTVGASALARPNNRTDAASARGIAAKSGTGQDDRQAIHAATQSLVMVEYTAQDELGNSKHVLGQGIVVSKSGVVMVSSTLIPEDLEKAYIKKLKIRLPMRHFSTVPAQYLGRTKDQLFCFIKGEKPLHTPPLAFRSHGQPYLGEKVWSVGLLEKSQDYKPYIGVNHVKYIESLVHTLAVTDTFGLTRPTSPVFDTRTNGLVGITCPVVGDLVILTVIGHGQMPVVVNDPDQQGAFYTWSVIKRDIRHVPTKPFAFKQPWLGLTGITGLKRSLRHAYNIKQRAGVLIGGVIPNFSAAKAGIKSQDIILTINGKAFSHSPVTSVMVQHFERLLEKTSPGQKVRFGVFRNGKSMTIPVTIGAYPTRASMKKHYFNHKLGLITRNLVFADTYARKLKPTQKGVLVMLIKPGSPAGLGRHRLYPKDLITKVDGKPITNEKDFVPALKKAEHVNHGKNIVCVVIRPNGSTAVCQINAKR